jgi:dihydrofolate reductase
VAKLIYSAIASLDGYIEDEKGTFGWAEPDDEVHAFVNDLERQVGTYLYGRRLYKMMGGWERIEREFEPDAVLQLKEAAGSDLNVGGAALAAEAFRAELVDECHLVLAPVLVGGGKHAFLDGVGLELELLQERRFASGMVFLRYRAVSSGS